MKTMSRKSGFSLVELLTVIAIIAILAAIIFPVMSKVKENARQNNCISNLKQIALAAAMFKNENRRFPIAIVPVIRDGSGNVQAIDNAKYDLFPGVTTNQRGLYPEYTKGTPALFHCPSSIVINKSEIANYTLAGGTPVEVYTYNGYDGSNYNNVFEPHYKIDWAVDVAAVAVANSGLSADGTATDDLDFMRQLKFRNPPPDTVVAWCASHEIRDGASGPGQYRGKAIVAFLDGSAAVMEASKVETCKWRVRPQ